MMNEFNKKLFQLAHLFNIQTQYLNYKKKRERFSQETIISILDELGQKIIPGNTRHLDKLIFKRRKEKLLKFIDDVLIIWKPGKNKIQITAQEKHLNKKIRLCVIDENNKTKKMNFSLKAKNSEKTVDLVIGRNPLKKKLKEKNQEKLKSIKIYKFNVVLPFDLKIGYYQLQISLNKNKNKNKNKNENKNENKIIFDFKSYLFVAPKKSYFPAKNQKRWGFFAPIYALKDNNNFGIGNFSNLRELSQAFYDKCGHHIVGTLPIQPCYLPNDISPYSAISKIFFNEIYLDINEILDQRFFQSFKEKIFNQILKDEQKIKLDSLNKKKLVDYKSVYEIYRMILQESAVFFFKHKNKSKKLSRDFDSFLNKFLGIKQYAKFRAKKEVSINVSIGTNTNTNTNLNPSPDTYRKEDYLYHLFVQWQCFVQFKKLKDQLYKNKCLLYLDFPIGVHPLGFDVYKYKKEFVGEFEVGAPPDPCFQGGQSWGFNPLHPLNSRKNGYKYFVDTIRYQMQLSDILRIDHILGFHRLFWIPKGEKPTKGVYYKYNANEFYAITNIESHRNKTIIVGEDLGLVPPYIPKNMDMYKIHHLYVLQYSLSGDKDTPIHPPPNYSLACLNTHDMFPFAAFVKKMDIDKQVELNWISSEEGNEQKKQRDIILNKIVKFLIKEKYLNLNINLNIENHINNLTKDEIINIIQSLWSFLFKSKSHFLLINLEDLWGEVLPQNIPGTLSENPNWQKKFTYNLNEINENHKYFQILKNILQK